MSAIPSYKEIVDLLKKGMTIEAQEKIMELRVEALAIQEENFQLRTRISELEKQLSTQMAMKFKKPFYVKEGDEHPYCPVCWEKSKLPIHLKGPDGDPHWYTCPNCKWQQAEFPEKVVPYQPISMRRDRSILG